MRKLGIIALCLLAIYGLARAADVENPFRPPATTCSNQFIRSLAAITGVGTCATVNFASDGTGVVPAANGGAGTITGALKGSGAGVVTQAACADLSNATGACSTTFVAPTSWTPADGSGAALTFTGVSANYVQIGNMVFAYATVTYPSTVSGSNAVINGLPINLANQNYAVQCNLTSSTIATLIHLIPTKNTGNINLATATSGAITNATMSTGSLNFMCIYPAT